MLRCTIFILLFVTSSSLFSQRPDFKKLKADVEAAETKEAKARAMADYAFALPNNQFDKILALSDSIQNMGQDASGPEFYDAVGEFTKGISYYRKEDYSRSKTYLKESVNRFRELNDPFEFKALTLLGIIYTRTSQRDSAIYAYNEILDRADTSNTKALLNAHGNLSNVYRFTGDYYKSISHSEKVYALDSTDAFTVMQLSMNTARIYSGLEMYDKALVTLKKVAIDTFPQIPPKGVFYNNIASVYRDMNNLDSALYYYKRAYENSKAINYGQLQATDAANIAETLLDLDSLEGVEKPLNDMKQHLPKTRDKRARLRYHLLLGRYQLSKGQADSAVINLKQALTFADDPRFGNMRLPIYEELIDLYNKQDDTKTAKLYIDSLSIAQRNPALQRKEQFDAEAKAKYLLAVKDNKISDSEKTIKSFSLQRWVLITIAVLLFVAVFFYFRHYRKSASGLKQQKSKNQQLNKTIERQHTKIVELKSKAVLEAEEIIFIKSDGHYLEFSLKSKKSPELDRNRLKDVIDKLPDYFVQIHRSYIINLKELKIKHSNKVMMKDGEELPVSRTYKAKLEEAINKFNV